LLPNFCRSAEAPTTAKPLGAAKKCPTLPAAEAVAWWKPWENHGKTMNSAKIRMFRKCKSSYHSDYFWNYFGSTGHPHLFMATVTA
jgi:hypothetical protein